MKVCFSCGAQETDLDSIFCQNCGSKLPDASSQIIVDQFADVPVKHEHSSSHGPRFTSSRNATGHYQTGTGSTKIILALLICFGVVFSLLVGGVVLGTMLGSIGGGDYDYAGTTHYFASDLVTLSNTSYNKIAFEFYNAMGNIDFVTEENKNQPFSVKISVSALEFWEDRWFESNRPWIDQANDTLYVHFDSAWTNSYERKNPFTYDLFIEISPELEFEIITKTDAGSIGLNFEDHTVGNITATTDAGSIDLIMQNVISTGSMTIETRAGSINAQLFELAFVGNNTYRIVTKAGSVELNLAVIGSLSVNTQQTFKVSSNVGSLDVVIDPMDDLVGVKATGETDIGSVNFPGGADPYVSDNYETADLQLIFELSTDVGSIELEYT